MSPEKYGLWHQYGHDEALFCLVSRTCTAMFGWEILDLGTVPISILDKQDILIGACGKLKDVLAATDPREFSDWLQRNHTELAGLYPSQGALLHAAYLRALQWAHHYRGPKEWNRNLIRTQFRSTLKPEEAYILQNGINLLRSLP